MSEPRFIHLRVHSDFSMVDGLAKTKPIIKAAAAQGMPALALTVRRLHDTGRSGWWIFVQMIPAVGGIVFLVFVCLDSQIGSNEYGPNPNGVAANPIWP